MRFFLSTLSLVASSVLLMRWGLDHATPDADMRRLTRLIGRVERAGTRLSARLTRLIVRVRAALGFDECAWEYLRWKWQQGGFSLDN